MRVKDAVGRFGEELAVAHLRAAGMEVLARNWRCREGELDVVARDGTELVFVEVKTRSSTGFGVPAEAVDRAKSARIRHLALRWLMERRDEGDTQWWSALRFDVVAVVRRASDGPSVTHLRAAF